jgi:hypothetical protein
MLVTATRTSQLKELVVSELKPAEIDELREWFCNTKPIGPSVRIVAPLRPDGTGGLRIVSSGTECESFE